MSKNKHLRILFHVRMVGYSFGVELPPKQQISKTVCEFHSCP